MSGSEELAPPPPFDGDRERAWIVEGLRRALANATTDELMRLVEVLTREVGDGEPGVAAWMVTLLGDELGRQELLMRELDKPDSGSEHPAG